MTTLKDRRWAVEVSVGGVATTYEHARIAFSSKMANGAGWTARLTYSNPSTGLLGQLSDRGALVRILAGYADTGAVEVARGAPVKGSVQYRRQGDPQVQVVLHATSTPLRSVVSGVIPGPCTARDGIDYIRRELGLPAGVISPRLADVECRRGLVFSGSPSSYLDELAASAGCIWDIPSGRLSVRPAAEGRNAVSADVWSPATGLLDVSSPGAEGEIRARALLRGALRPGDVVRLDGVRHAGELVLREVTHEGDTHGDRWWTTIEGVPRA